MKTKEELKAYLKAWRKKNRERWNAYGRKWISKNKKRHARNNALWAKQNPEKRREITKRYKQAHRDEIAERQRVRLLDYKTQVVNAYGGGCRCCGEKNIVFLTVEHIKKNGKEHRRKVGGNFYYYLVKNGFPREYLCILCMNCNWAERNGFRCPHKTSPFA